MGKLAPAALATGRNPYARLAVRLNQSRPSHVWQPYLDRVTGLSKDPGCSKCPAGSPFREDRVSHLYIIEEEPCP